MRNFYDSWVYNVQYWRNGSDEKVSEAHPAHLRWSSLCSAQGWSGAVTLEGGARRPQTQGLARWQHLKVRRPSGLVF